MCLVAALGDWPVATKMQLQTDFTISHYPNGWWLKIQPLPKAPIKKDQLKIGSILHYYGKDEPNTRWEVWRIWYTLGERKYAHNKIYTVNDKVVLWCQKLDRPFKTISFRHISKSPLWRLQ